MPRTAYTDREGLADRETQVTPLNIRSFSSDTQALILCDLDGVLVEAEPEAHILAHLDAVARIFNAQVARSEFWNAIEHGMTDRWIGAKLIDHAGGNRHFVTGDQVEWWRAELARLFDFYSEGLGLSCELLPHVEQGLQMISDQSSVILGLATGNIQHIAQRKLSYTGLDKYFEDAPAGFGDFAIRKHELIADALFSAGWFSDGNEPNPPMGRAFLIGDTVKDIEGALHHEVRPVGLTTGGHGVKELHEAGAEAVFLRFDRAVEWILDQCLGPTMQTDLL